MYAHSVRTRPPAGTRFARTLHATIARKYNIFLWECQSSGLGSGVCPSLNGPCSSLWLRHVRKVAVGRVFPSAPCHRTKLVGNRHVRKCLKVSL